MRSLSYGAVRVAGLVGEAAAALGVDGPAHMPAAYWDGRDGPMARAEIVRT